MITEVDIEIMTDAERRRVLSWIMRRIQRPQRRGKHICRLQAMRVGDSIMLATHGDGSNLCTAKRVARERMGCPNAQWRSRMTNLGRRVTRTA